MLHKICIQISKTILSVLVDQTKVKEGAICNPKEYFSTIHRMISGVLGIVFHHNLYPKPEAPLAGVFQNLRKSLSSSCLFVENFEESSPKEIEALNVFFQWFQVQGFGKINVSDLYELMLGLEFPIQNGLIVEDHDGQILDTIGSFYTPVELADKTVQLTLDNYIFENTGITGFSSSEKPKTQVDQVSALLQNSSFADHSCGTGNFLLAILGYVEKHVNTDMRQIQEQMILNFEAIEADPIALEIAKIQILINIDRLDLYSKISTKFIHGNPILKPIKIDSSFSFSNEFYYHNGLAMNPDRLKKCDVIVGNPPWGEVGFDLAFFCHIILPKVNEVRSQEELEEILGTLETSHPFLFDWLLEHEEANDQAVDAIYEDKRFQYSTIGGLHANVIFMELINSLSTDRGSVGLILKGSTLSDKNNKKLVKHLESKGRMVSRYDFKNIKKIFNIDAEEDFSIVILGNLKGSKTTHLKDLTSLDQLIN